MKPSELVSLLQTFYREKLALWDRHVRGAEAVGDYDINNTYQYIIAREDTQLGWIRRALIELGGTVPDEAPRIDVPAAARGEERQRAIIAGDLQGARDFESRWRPRIEPITNARQRGMLKVILGETLEHARFFEQALAGRNDLLGSRPASMSTGGGVLPTRWIE